MEVLVVVEGVGVKSQSDVMVGTDTVVKSQSDGVVGIRW